MLSRRTVKTGGGSIFSDFLKLLIMFMLAFVRVRACACWFLNHWNVIWFILKRMSLMPLSKLTLNSIFCQHHYIIIKNSAIDNRFMCYFCHKFLTFAVGLYANSEIFFPLIRFFIMSTNYLRTIFTTWRYACSTSLTTVYYSSWLSTNGSDMNRIHT